MKRLILFAGPLLAATLGTGLALTGSSPAIAWTAAVTCLSAIWWIFEPIPIPATSLIAIAVLPLVGVLTPAEVGESYGSPLILLMMGGFMLSTAMERSGVHRRIALGMVSLFGGTSSCRLVLGFMSASALLSMWISNAATTLMLLPIVVAVLERTKDQRLKVSLLLGIAYAASIGGIGTPIGSPPNLVFMQIYARTTGIEPTFLDWMKWSIPIVVVMFPIVGFWLTRGLATTEPISVPKVGVWRAAEVRTLIVFAVTAVLWITRAGPLGGWSGLVGLPNANDASISLLAVIAMFIVPNGNGGRLLDWQSASKIPWGVLLLFGSGVAIAKAFDRSGLSDSLGSSLAGLGSLPVFAMIASVCLAVTFLTEVTSNTATAVLLMPILAAVAHAAQIDPKLIMAPAAISASFAFMLPVATPPNAIVFSREELTVQHMARVGIGLNLVGAAVVSTICYFTLT